MSRDGKEVIICLAVVISLVVLYMIFLYIVIDPRERAYADKATPETVVIETIIESESEATVEAEIKTETESFYYDIPLDNDLQDSIKELCDQYNFDYETALAIIKTESDFTVDAIGDNGQATGLCQIWSYYWGDLAEDRGLNLNDPVDNVECMLIIMSGFLENHTLTEALQMYNTGSPEGAEYADRVYSNLSLIESEARYYGTRKNF